MDMSQENITSLLFGLAVTFTKLVRVYNAHNKVCGLSDVEGIAVEFFQMIFGGF